MEGLSVETTARDRNCHFFFAEFSMDISLIWINTLTVMQFLTNKLLAEVTFLADLLCFLFRKTWRLANLDITSPACCLMFLPPEISGAWCTIHGTFHHAKVRWSSLAWPITTPPVLLVKFHFIMEAVENLKQEAKTHSSTLNEHIPLAWCTSQFHRTGMCMF